MRISEYDIIDSKVWNVIVHEISKKLAFARAKLETCDKEDTVKYQEQIRCYKAVLEIPQNIKGDENA